MSGETYITRFFDFSTDGFPVSQDLTVGACVYCADLGSKAVTIALEDGYLAVYFKQGGAPDLSEPKFDQLAPFPNPSCIATFALDEENCTYLIASGARDGTVGLWYWHFENDSGKADYKEIFRRTIHQGVVSSVCFYNAGTLLSGGMDSKIYKLDITDYQKAPDIKGEFALTLQCRGMKINGVKGEREKAILEAAGATRE